MTIKKGSASGLRTPLLLGAVAVLSAGLGFAAVYVTVGGSDNVSVPSKAGKTSPGASKPATGEAGKTGDLGGDLAGFVYKRPPAALANVPFLDGDGKSLNLADFKGKTVLLNLWATWCAPCKAEMPSLDRLQARLGSQKFEVVALSVDRKGIEAARRFLKETNSTNLKLYVDPTAKAGSVLAVVGMPTTILIGSDGREIGRLVGPAEWDSADAIKIVEAAQR